MRLRGKRAKRSATVRVTVWVTVWVTLGKWGGSG